VRKSGGRWRNMFRQHGEMFRNVLFGNDIPRLSAACLVMSESQGEVIPIFLYLCMYCTYAVCVRGWRGRVPAAPGASSGVRDEY
jgi:hypothetical protein